jgi:phage terminase large subunit
LILKPQIARAFKPLLAPRRFKGAKGGRGGAKSHFFAELGVIEAVSGHQRFVYAREHQNSIADSSKQLIEDKIGSLGLNGMFKITDREIVCPSTDTLFVFRGLKKHTVSSVKSMEGFTRLVVDEAQVLSQKSLDIAIPTFRMPGSEIRFSWNPNAASDPIDKFFADNENDPDFACINVNYWDNPWFPEELRKDMERDKKRDHDKYLHIWCGEYQRNSEARVFSNWKIEAFNTPYDAVFYQGADWGFSVDPTVLVRCFINGRTLYVDREVYKVGCEIDHTPALFDRLDPDHLEVARKWRIRADSARPETISYMRRNGYPKIEGALKGPSSVMDGIEFLKSYDIVVHPRCKHTSDELMHYCFKTDPLTGEVIPVLEDKKNHVIDALRYAVETIRRGNFNNNIGSAVQVSLGAPQ